MVSTLAPSARQNAASRSTAAGSASGGGVRMHQRLTNSSAKPASGPEYSVPATGCAGMKWTPRGTCGRHVAQHRALHRADVGENRARLEMCGDLLGHRAALADRDADDDEVGACGRLRIGLDHLVGEAELGDAPARRGRTRSRDDGAHHALRARRACDRGADQADADQGKAVEQGPSVIVLTERSRFPHELGERLHHQPVRLFAADASCAARWAACRRRPGAGSGRAR